MDPFPFSVLLGSDFVRNVDALKDFGHGVVTQGEKDCRVKLPIKGYVALSTIPLIRQRSPWLISLDELALSPRLVR